MIYKPYHFENSIKINDLYCLFKLTCHSGYTFNGEMHDFWECVYVIDGNLSVSSDVNIYNLKKGDIVFHKPQEFHKIQVDLGEKATIFNFSFSLEGSLAEKMAGKVCSLDPKQLQIIKQFIDFFDEEYKKHYELKEPIYQYNVLPFFENDDLYLQTVSLFITQLIISLSKNDISFKSVETRETILLKQAIHEMNKYIESSLSITDLAKSLNISLSTLKRVFIKLTGMSVYKFYLTIKIRTASTMLQSGMSVSDVSNKLGFSSLAYFSSTYKRETGHRPTKDIPKN